ncbi:UDP-glycosyltransferase UGT5-like, partial [Rhagoletis pomonella]|uniref:UDP-glycosyltransferase UGT5-like n=1 Tax=Rhagoletis pomonella TaxID=28610 RepID=UPI00177D6BBA
MQIWDSFKFVKLALMILIFAIDCIETAKILAVFPFTGPSQYLCVQPYLKTLVARGHEVTSISAFPQKTPITNFRDIVLNGVHDDHDELVMDVIDEMAGGKLKELHAVWDYIMLGSLLVLENEEFQQLLRSKEHFDLIIIEVFLQESLYALGDHFNAPLIGVSTFGSDISIDQLVDNSSPLAYVPSPTARKLDHKNFYHRLSNLYVHTMELAYTHMKIIPDQQRLYEKYFPNATADLSEVRRDFSLLLLNQHYSFNYARPLVPNAIEVAGMHIDHKPTQLPTDMEAFINASPNGAIYFSLGSNVKSVFLRKEKLDAIMNAFAKLPVNVLWKFEKDDLPGKPKNVYVSKWFPQQDILAHTNVKLFITHGGMHSLLEAVYHGKPVVGMSVFFDQHMNVARAVAKGFGVSLNFR